MGVNPILLRTFLLTTLSAVLYVLAFPKWDFSYLAWVALIPALLAQNIAHQHRLSYLKVFFLSAWMSLLVGFGGFFWITYAMREFGGLPMVVCIIGLILFSLCGQLQFYAYFLCRRFLNDRYSIRLGVLRLLGFSLLYALWDRFLPKLFMDTLGHSFLGMPWMRQGASLGGAYFLTAAAVLVNEALATAWQNRKQWTPHARSEVVTAGVMVLALGIYGQMRYTELRAWIAAPPRETRVGVIQGNIGDIDKIASETGNQAAADQVVDTYIKMSEQAFQQSPAPDFLVWPETAYPALFRNPAGLSDLEREQKIDTLINRFQKPVLFGGYDTEKNKDFNALFLYAPGPGGLRTYRKNILLPFGEYIPWIGKWKWVEKLFPLVGNFGQGIGPESIPIRLGEGRYIYMGPLICYEALFPEYTREAAKLNSELLVNITNDSWFGPRSEPELHLALTVFRSLETGIPQLRATNTGISALILPDGSLSDLSPINQALVLNWKIPLEAPRARNTLYVQWGENWIGLSFILLLITLGALEWNKRKKIRTV